MREAVSITAGIPVMTGTNFVCTSHTNKALLLGTSLPKRVSCVAMALVAYRDRRMVCKQQ